ILQADVVHALRVSEKLTAVQKPLPFEDSSYFPYILHYSFIYWKKLKDTLLNPDSSGEKALTVQGEGQGGASTPIPARIRKIVTCNLKKEKRDAPQEMPLPGSLQEENRLLPQELWRIEDLLSQTLIERDELLMKNRAVNDLTKAIPSRTKIDSSAILGFDPAIS
ncbi:putative ciliary rootlet coiled-coil protein 2, partial [Acipenser oxyrinchus oxyrinchus]